MSKAISWLREVFLPIYVAVFLIHAVSASVGGLAIETNSLVDYLLYLVFFALGLTVLTFVFAYGFGYLFSFFSNRFSK